MATKNQRVSYIASTLKGLGAPSETAIAICCNIRAEAGSAFNPQAIEVGSGAPPFIRNGQGYGLFQFSNYPTNYSIYTACKDKADKGAIQYQIKQLNTLCQPGKGNWFTSAIYPKYNLSWNEFLTNKRNWTPRELTRAFMCQYERPADQSQDRYAMFSKEVADAYDWSKYDSNGGDNAGNGDHETYNFDCGGAKIVLPKEPDPPVDPGGGGGGGGSKPPSSIESAVKYIQNRANKGQCGWKNGAGYQCVALIQYGYLPRADSKWADSRVPMPNRMTAYGYGTYFRTQLNAGKTAAGLSPKKWQWYSGKSFRRGDIIFYNRTPANGSAGHVNVAISSTKALNQNILPPYNGSRCQITQSNIKSGLGSTPFGALRKIKN